MSRESRLGTFLERVRMSESESESESEVGGGSLYRKTRLRAASESLSTFRV